MTQRTRPRPGEMATIRTAPPGLLQGLPLEDQEAILEAVGEPMHLLDIDSDGRAELEFTDKHGVIHFIYVDAGLVEPIRS
jgi:hypothetical protein